MGTLPKVTELGGTVALQRCPRPHPLNLCICLVSQQRDLKLLSADLEKERSVWIFQVGPM